ncbi:F-box protein At3g62230 [Manihot esculenta]|uniref:F-box protein At3g62230 n=1 Tax=Manihot esculenta TaxID=3983 RepID=UPI000B5D5365|nr:F-box protein At3g62230 [Manihot esculenta]
MDSNNLDLFSTLTSSLLVLIVSYLPFKEAVRTSILSKRWRNIWRETKSIEFHEKFFVDLEETEEKQRIQRSSLFDFARNFVASYPQGDIRKFAMACSKPEGFLTDIQNFIIFAVSRNVRELELEFSDPRWNEDDDDENHPAVVELPYQVFLNEGLESLKFFSCKFDVSRLRNFKILKGVSFGWIEISMVSIKFLMLCCPLIETLSLKKCRTMHHLDICIPNLRLKNLVLDKCSFIRDFFWIGGPKLRFFKYSGKVGDFHLYNQRRMVEADLDFGMVPEFAEFGSLLYDFLQEFYAVKVLTVCSVLLQLIPREEEPFSLRFPLNVRHLILKTAMHSFEFYGMSFMFTSCPKLKILTFDIGPAKIFPDYEPPFDLNPQEVWTNNLWAIPQCFDRSLEVVNVKGFRGTLDELRVLRYIINFGRKLKKLNLFLSEEEEDNGQNSENCVQKVRHIVQSRSPSLNLQVFVF